MPWRLAAICSAILVVTIGGAVAIRHYVLAPGSGPGPAKTEPSVSPRLVLSDSAPTPYSAAAGAYSVVFSPDDTTLAMGMYDGVVRLWNVAKRTKIADIRVAAGWPVDCLAFSPDGSTLAACADGITLWNVASRKRVGTLHTPDKPYAIAFSPDGKTIAVRMQQNPTQVLDVTTGTLAASLPMGAVFSPDGRTIAAQTTDGVLHLWKQPGVTQIATWSTAAEDYSSLAMAFSPGGETLAAGGSNRSSQSALDLWNLSTHKAVALGTGITDDSIGSVVFTPNGRFLASASAKGAVRMWSIATTKIAATLFAGALQNPILAMRPDGQTIAVASMQGIQLWDLGSAGAIAYHVPTPHPQTPTAAPAISVTPAGTENVNCGPVIGSPDSVIAYVISGTISCRETIQVFNTQISMPAGQIPGKPVTFDGWTCTFTPARANDQSRKTIIDDCRKGGVRIVAR
ncbi:WD40 repeat domain-containing protein [Actinoallomurus acanthiterrae]